MCTKNIAVLLTVFNRREVTLQGIRSLYKAIDYLGGDYQFDIYMTDDGCTDGTGEAVKKEFPDVQVIQGDGGLYWCGGMRKAWHVAIDSGRCYDYYLWFNDDAALYNDALNTMFMSLNDAGDNSIISGAFCDESGGVSYGGRDKKKKIIVPNGTLQRLFLMNGNLVLIPIHIVNSIGIIDEVFKHSFGDWDYGCRAFENGFNVFLSSKYVGVTNRHDDDIEPYLDENHNIIWRFKKLYSDKHSAIKSFVFCKRHLGILKAIKVFVLQNIYTFCPIIHRFRLCIK